MAGTNYIINPVKATCMKYSGQDQGIQGINDTCFGICAAFSGTNDTYAMDPNCSQACTDLVEQRKHEIFGVGSCDHQVPYRPVSWGQVPRFVPGLLKKGIGVEKARETCKNMCKSAVPLLSAECMENCDLDANSVEEFKTLPQPKPKPKIKLNKNPPKSPEKPKSKVIWIVLSIVVLCIFVRIMFI